MSFADQLFAAYPHPTHCVTWRQALLRALPDIDRYDQTPSRSLFNMATPKRKIVIDTDVGTDDAVALLSLLKSTNCEVQAITTVDGNTSLADVIANTSVLLAIESEKYGHIPIYVGAKGPLIQAEGAEKLYWDGHGKDGFGNSRAIYEAEIADIIANVDVRDEHAASALVRMCKAERGMTLVAIGPLTNVALAIRLDPNFLTYIDKVYIMGGSLLGKGNATRAAEFNFACDPEAAHVVFTSSSKLSVPGQDPKIVLAPWELTLDNALSWDTIDYISDPAKHADHPWAKLMYRIMSPLRTAGRTPKHLEAVARATSIPPRHDFHAPDFGTDREAEWDSYYVTIPDMCATFAITIPECIEKSIKVHAEIELAGTMTRGMMCLKWHSYSDARTLPANCTILTHLNLDMMDAELRRITSKDA
ncbi:Inosine/uridine-preferring nucleoside hydrolase domain-containing protein [Blastocladiella britannica]|nr:Inosine/uridine-preferring nucleoside hydrolase domain-containing protein [Blastocladiella britannica]